MPDLRVKICGLTRAEDMRWAADCGADFVGLVFADSPRRVEPDAVAEWLEEARGDAEVVGVFRDASVEEVRSIAERLDLDLVQLHGSERGPAWAQLGLRLIETRQVGEGGPAAERLGGAAWAQLLDAGAGDGKRFDWDHAVPVVRERRVFLAGGLDPTNVAAAIERVHPFAVDVSSGVERAPGEKDPALVEAFLRAARGEATA